MATTYENKSLVADDHFNAVSTKFSGSILPTRTYDEVRLAKQQSPSNKLLLTASIVSSPRVASKRKYSKASAKSGLSSYGAPQTTTNAASNAQPVKIPLSMIHFSKPHNKAKTRPISSDISPAVSPKS